MLSTEPTVIYCWGRTYNAPVWWFPLCYCHGLAGNMWYFGWVEHRELKGISFVIQNYFEFSLCLLSGSCDYHFSMLQKRFSEIIQFYWIIILKFVQFSSNTRKSASWRDNHLLLDAGYLFSVYSTALKGSNISKSVVSPKVIKLHFFMGFFLEKVYITDLVFLYWAFVIVFQKQELLISWKLGTLPFLRFNSENFFVVHGKDKTVRKRVKGNEHPLTYACKSCILHLC